MKRNNILVITLIILVIGFIPLMGFIHLKQQTSSLKFEISLLQGEPQAIQELQAEIQTLKDDRAMVTYNQKQLIQAVDKFLDAWQVETLEPPSYSPDEVLDLATLIDNEARNQPYIGKIAVGAVVINRVEYQGFGDSISEVIFSPGQFTELRYVGDQLLPESIKAARAAMNGIDPTKGAIYFYNPKTAESQWITTRPKIVQIKDHIFAR